jgi:hypothetical protein
MKSRKSNYFIVTVLVGVISIYSPSTLAVDPKIFLESSVIKGAGGIVKIRRVPVQDSAGAIKYLDISLSFDVNDAGEISLSPGSPQITPSPKLKVGEFKQGVYTGSLEGVLYDVGSPGIGPGGRAAGSINSRPRLLGSSTCRTDRLSVSWVTGPIQGHPNEAALTAAGITSTTLSWGAVSVMDDNCSDVNDYPGWENGNIIGAIQTGNQLSIHNFGNDNAEDSVLVFTLCPTCPPPQP